MSRCDTLLYSVQMYISQNFKNFLNFCKRGTLRLIGLPNWFLDLAVLGSSVFTICCGNTSENIWVLKLNRLFTCLSHVDVGAATLRSRIFTCFALVRFHVSKSVHPGMHERLTDCESLADIDLHQPIWFRNCQKIIGTQEKNGWTIFLNCKIAYAATRSLESSDTPSHSWSEKS